MIRDDNEAILNQAALWRDAGQSVALAHVIATWGSAPRPVGSLMAVSASGAMAGSVSGGCVEGAVVMEAGKVLADGEPRFLSFGISNEMAWEVGLACGGKLEVYVEPIQ
ncbi:XdhC family protein [Niveispirillum cyanobacteriorum]|uniref:Xanthine dehydrogenase n=1 Tax=Niveispirillum cyanobacteriorum TaxID=1612173 RepID=A0A2K9N8R3_9PROT|nr:XdhC family protein [Niveispirillum cyanobacteriorum]AUN29487.1 xanthine dehydrogenase [Niveispirillum cyanobacteriorum]GGE87281.1 sulfurylase small subunit, molybdopterin cytosine dinucleotide biosynthesis [Niveispirillum cyanobacteriorum]